MLNIDNLTIGEIKQIQSLFGTTTQTEKTHPFIGKYCIVRCYRAGVHAGEVVDVQPSGEAVYAVTLKNARRLHGWTAANGKALSGVAIHGLKNGGNTRVDTLTPDHWVSDCCELIPTSTEGRMSIEEST